LAGSCEYANEYGTDEKFLSENLKGGEYSEESRVEGRII
jgi:hypothetical protein